MADRQQRCAKWRARLARADDVPAGSGVAHGGSVGNCLVSVMRRALRLRGMSGTGWGQMNESTAPSIPVVQAINLPIR
ncbi:hypothetical protein PCAR4_340125 [Paraburkholderia caribensis]|nr:hypothetical protein PCAR4_340125 [Paraburkholderia caribensis]